jgi:amino acid adenylation domain-containing protein
VREKLGRGIDGVDLLVLDRSNRLAGIGETGEICIRTPYLARGYAGDRAATEERFVSSPFTQSSGDRIFRTGDLGRYWPDGNVEFVGRTDRQLKIRGFRVEPAEIESALETDAGVDRVLVGDWRDSRGEIALVAYVVPVRPEAVSVDELRRHISTRLPDYMTPSAIMFIDSIPLTPNGKVDRGRLPAPSFDLVESGRTHIAPRNSIEEALLDLWTQVLRVERINITDSFFELGGHSLLATSLVSRIQKAFSIELPLRTFFQSPAIADLAPVVAELRDRRQEYEDSFADLPAIVPAPGDGYEPFPLTHIQEAYWIGRMGAIEIGVASHRYLEIECADLNVERLSAAWRTLIERHHMLRAIVQPDGKQRVLEQVPPYVIETGDLRGRTPDEVEERLATIRHRMSHQVMSPDKWPLFEIRVSIPERDRFRIHFSFDYLIADARSFQIIFEELVRLYLDPEAELPRLDLSFRDYVLALESLESSNLARRSRDYWWNRLDSLPAAPDLPLAKAPAMVADPRFVRRSARFEPETWRRIKSFAARAGVTPSVVLLAAFNEVLAAWSKTPRFTIVLTLFNRLPMHPQVDSVVGDFTSTTLLAADVSGGGFLSRCRSLQEQLWNDLDHRYVSGVLVLRELAKRREAGIRAAMPVVFTSTLARPLAAENYERMSAVGKVVYGLSQTPQVWLDHQVSEQAGALLCSWDAVDELFPEGLLDGMFEAFCGLVGGLATDEKNWQAATHRLVPETQLKQRAEVNATESPLPPYLLHTLFVRQAREHPGNPAVIAPNRTLSYAELLALSSRIARCLQSHGARANSLVAVVTEKGWEQVAAVLAILQSGAAYVPIDAGLPQERLWRLLEDSGARIVLTQSGVDASIEWPENVTRFILDEHAFDEFEGAPLDPCQTQEDLAYVIYTSGSTGIPKGVMIDHRGAVNTILDINSRFETGPADRVLALSSLSFDLSVYDIFGMLSAGGAIVIPEANAGRNPERWRRLVEESQVTVWNTVPALMEMMTQYVTGEGESLPGSLRLILMSGDWIPVYLPDQIRAISETVTIVSLGGATEASIWSILYPIETVDPAWKSVPYGKPMANQTFHVLDESLQPSPVFVPGRLYIGGVGLAKGYWGDEEKTRKSFITHPETGERLYHTGDLGRYLPDGNIEFLGREDFQVKIHGYRIELGEIEAALAEHPGVRAFVVNAAGEPRGEKRLVAYFVPDGDAPRVDEMQSFLRSKLPEYMVPSAFVMLDALPLTANGKVDRAALPLPEHAEQTTANAYVAPRTPVEAELASLFSQVLGVDRVGVHDNFFALGGSSLNAVGLIHQVREQFHVDIPLRTLFESPYISTFALRVLECQGEQVESDEMAELLDQLESLSPEEVQRLLQEETAI